MASIIDKDRFRGRETASQGTGGGDGVDGIVKRLENVESAVTEIRGDIREIKVVLPTLATKTELTEVRGDIREIRVILPTLATKQELTAGIGSLMTEMALLRADMNALETRVIKWLVGTVLTASAVSFSAAKFFS